MNETIKLEINGKSKKDGFLIEHTENDIKWYNIINSFSL